MLGTKFFIRLSTSTIDPLDNNTGSWHNKGVANTQSVVNPMSVASPEPDTDVEDRGAID